MMRKQFLRAAALTLAFGLGAVVAGHWAPTEGVKTVTTAAASGVRSAPTETRGFKATAPATIDLGPEIAGMEGRQMRLRVLTIEPGGVIGLHSHMDRPAIAHLLEGTLTNHREDGTFRDIHPGASWSEGKDTTHWVENRGPKPVVFVAVDIVQPELGSGQ